MLGIYAFSQVPLSTLPPANYSELVSENVSLYDYPVGSLGVYFSAFENLNPASVESITAGFASSISENYIPDTSIVIGSGYLIPVVEPIGVQDQPLAVVNFPESASEDIGLSDVILIGSAFATSISEPLTPDDSLGVVADFAASISEPIAGADVLSVTAQLNTSISENLTPQAQAIVSAAFTYSITENIAEADFASVAAGFAAQRSEGLHIGEIISYFHYPVVVGWTPINTDIYTYDSGALMLGAATWGEIPFSGYLGGTTIVTPAWAEGSYCSSVVTNVTWNAINTDIYTTATPIGIMFGGTPISSTAISGFSGGEIVVTPNWKDIINN